METLRWTAPGAELEVLSTQPSACVKFNAELEPSVDYGRALFNSSTLLGGQAAKAGLSCASCHVNGRGNPHFMLAGVSGKPGTADVTNSFFSAARGNGRFDPVPIPDLAFPAKVSRDAGNKALEKFIRDLIVDEFAGDEPDELAIEAIANYVRAIGPCGDDDKLPEPRKVDDQRKIIAAQLKAAQALVVRGDNASDIAKLIAGARQQLGIISERYAGPKLARERTLLLGASRQLQKIAETQEPVTIKKWQLQFDTKLAPMLRRKENKSLYNAQRLSKHLQR
jgi:hypothetical protein